MNNSSVADIFRKMADILEMENENTFRIRAYRNAAETVENLGEDISKIAKNGRLTSLPGIGNDLSAKIQEFLGTGKISAYDKLCKKTSPAMLDILNIPGVGPKTAKILNDNLKIKSIEDLEKKVRSHLVSGLPGIKEKTEENILKGLEFLKKNSGRMRLDTAFTTAQYIISELRKVPEATRISPAGSLRRMKETIRDLDILVTSKKPKRVMDVFVNLPNVSRVTTHGPAKSSIVTKDNVRVDIRVVSPENYGAALMYFTGSKEHNIRLREMAARNGLKINEYGIFNAGTNKKLAGNSEEDMYKLLRMDYVEPELRENTGEIECAMKSSLPRIVETGDIRGDFHVHTEASDGSLSISEVAKIASKKGYEYIVIADHSASLKIAGGLSEKQILRHKARIEAFSKKSKGTKLLAGSEVDILDDGRLDYRDEILKKMDFVVAAIHNGFNQSKDKLTGRIIKAMRNKYVNLIAHPSGRLIGQRAAYELDYDKIFAAARETNTAIEINAHPERLDLTDVNSRRAKKSDVKIAISTDSHAAAQFDNMIYGVSVARRGWLEKKDILNSLSLKDILRFVAKKRL